VAPTQTERAVNAFDIELAKWFGDRIHQSRPERIALLWRMMAFFSRALRAEESDAAYAARAQTSRVDYREHLRSDYWRRLRSYVYVVTSGVCQGCGADCGRALELHHPDYTALGHESLSDVVGLCRDCHAALHDLTPKQRS
jgi:hypothetical protein